MLTQKMSLFYNVQIPTFVLSSANRTQIHPDEFSSREEFDITTLHLQPGENLAIRQWNTIQFIIDNLLSPTDDYFILSDEDHQFTGHYNKELLVQSIYLANGMNAAILSGGVSRIGNCVRVDEYIYWVDSFAGLQFTVLFRRSFESIRGTKFTTKDGVSQKLTSLTDRKFLIYPFITLLKEPAQPEASLKLINQVTKFYIEQTAVLNRSAEMIQYDNVFIPTYIINLPERKDRLDSIKEQFSGRTEFKTTVVEACRHEIGAVGLWYSIRKIVQLAIESDEDVILICEDDHEFTSHYCKEAFLQLVFEANAREAEILLGGIGGLGSSVMVSDKLFWTDFFWCTQFTVVFKSLFKRIMDEPFTDSVTADGLLSEITSNKLVIYPFISTQKYLGGSSINAVNSQPGRLAGLFTIAAGKLARTSAISNAFPPNY